MNFLMRVANLAGKPFGINPFPRAFGNSGTLGTDDRGAAFNNIYESKAWNSDESASGPGSEHARVAGYRARLQDYLHAIDARSIFDAPCGDLNWILPAVAGLAYKGGDISTDLIAELHRTHPELDLSVFDICVDRFPSADVWHCRDCLFHLPFADIDQALRNYVRSDIPFAFLTSHRSRILHRNLDIPVGGWRYLDLTEPPISLPEPVTWLQDYRPGIDFPRYVGVWRREQIAALFG